VTDARPADGRAWEPPGLPRRADPVVEAPLATPVPTASPGIPPTAGWTPPPRPGLVPLRPLGLGTIISASFGVLRRNALATFGPALLVCLALAVVKSLGTIALLTSLVASSSDDVDAVGAVSNGLGGALVSFLGSTALDLAGTQLVLAIVALATAGGTVGERRRPGAIWRRTRGRRLAVVGWALLVAVVAFAGIGVVIGAVVLIAIAGGAAGTVIAFLLLGIAIPGALVLWAWLTTKLAFVPPALVVERLRMRAAIRRSWRLTRGRFWRVLGVRLLVTVMVGAAQALLGIPIQLLATLVASLVLPNGASDADGSTLLIVVTLLTQTAGAFVTAVTLVLTTATTSLLYVDVRMRAEGLDLELARYVEHAPGTRGGLPDPFRRPEAAA
jgi:hypothetical protein